MQLRNPLDLFFDERRPLQGDTTRLELDTNPLAALMEQGGAGPRIRSSF
jgi:hypothetical protein